MLNAADIRAHTAGATGTTIWVTTRSAAIVPGAILAPLVEHLSACAVMRVTTLVT
jgi:hypothetical protein